MTANPLTGLRLAPDVRAWLRRQAAERDVTPARVVEQLVREQMARPVRVNF